MNKNLCPALFLLVFLAASLQAGEKTFFIEDPFGVDHGKQAVVFTQTFDNAGTPLESLGATVDDAPAFFQRRALETYPDGSVKTGEWTLWLHLASPGKKNPAPAGSRPKFTVKLTWGGSPANPAAFPDTPVKISSQGDYLLVDTATAQFLVPNNTVTRAASGVQGPIASFRSQQDPLWYGSNSYLEGVSVASVNTKVLLPGPARAVIAVTFFDGEEVGWTSELTFTAGSPVVKILDTMDLQGAWVIDLTNDMAPDTQFACPWFDWESSNQRGNPSEKPLRAWTASEIRGGEWPDLNEFFRLDPKWHDYQYMKGPYAWYYNKADREHKKTAFAMFAWEMTKWHPTNGSRPRVYVQGNAKGVLRIRVPLSGGPHTRTLEAPNPADPTPRVIRTSTAERSWGIAAFPTPDIQSADALMPRAEAEARANLPRIAKELVQREKKELQRRAEEEVKAAAGRNPALPTGPDAIAAKMRELGWPTKSDDEIAAGKLAAMQTPPLPEVRRLAEKMAAETAAPVRATSLETLVRFAHLPLTKIKDWIFTWPDVDRNVDRGIFRGLDEAKQLQQELQAGKSELARFFHQRVAEMRKTLVRETDNKGRTTEKVAPQYGNDWQVAKAILEEDVFSGPVFKYTPRGGLRPDPRWIYLNSYTDGQLNPTTAPRGIRAVIWENSLNYLWKKDGRTAVNRSMAVMAYIFSDPDFWNGRYYDWGIGNPNFHTDMHNVPGMVASQIHTHPHAQKWADYSKREIYADVARSSWQPGGGWTESPGYTAHAFSVFIPTAHAFRRAGLVDPFADQTFRDAITFYMNLLTPFDKRRGVRSQISIGDSSSEVRTENLLQAAMAYAQSDPKFAGDLMAAARSSITSGDLIKPGTLGNTLATTNPSIPASPDWKLESRYYGGVGAFFRSRFGRPDEGLVTFKAGPARNHYQGDELSFTYWGNGDYLAVDYSSFYNPRMNPDWTHNKVSFGLAASSPVARMMMFESTPVADVAVADNVNDSLSLMTPPYAAARALWDYPPIRTAPKTNRRLLAFVKHAPDSPFADYLVVRDELTGDLADRLDAAQLRTRLAIVIGEMMEAYITDASYASSQAESLFEEFQFYLRLFGAPDSVAADLVNAARQAVEPGRTAKFRLANAPHLQQVLNAALLKFVFSHAPRSNLHLLARENPKKSRDRLEFEGQMDSGIVVYVATGQDVSQADVHWFGWGHNRRPDDFVKGPIGPKGEEPLPWMQGPVHSYRHGFVLRRDVRLATDPPSPLPPYTFGEMAQWLSIPFGDKNVLTVVLYPVGKGKSVPHFEASDDGRTVLVKSGSTMESITLASDRPVRVLREGQETVVAQTLPPIGSEQPVNLTPRRTIEGGTDKIDDMPNVAEP